MVLVKLSPLSFSYGDQHYRPYVAKYKKKYKRIQYFDNCSYKTYITRNLRYIHPELKLSEKSKDVINSFINDMFDRLAKEASFLTKCISRRRTMIELDIQSAAKLVLTGFLQKYAIVEGKKAIERFEEYPNGNQCLSLEKYSRFEVSVNKRRTSSPKYYNFTM